MSAFGPKRTSLIALHMCAFGCEADLIAISAIASPAKQKTRHKAGYVRRGKLKLTAGLTAPAPSQASGGSDGALPEEIERPSPIKRADRCAMGQSPKSKNSGSVTKVSRASEV